MKFRALALISASLLVSAAQPTSAALFNWGKAKATNPSGNGTETPVAESAIPSAPSSRQSPPSSELAYEEFKALAVELAPKVNLFRDVWAQAPNAEFFGGTTRDYLYWLKGQLRKARSAQELEETIRSLRARKSIDLKEFVAPGSDVDIVAKRDSIVLDAERYGVKRIDFVNIARFNTAHPVGETEVKQGFIPIEKMRLSRYAVYTDAQFGDGVKEFYDSKPTVRFASDREFAESYYAKLGINHPILLGLRYVRIVAMDYNQMHGSRRPHLAELLSSMDKASHDAVMRVMRKALDGKELLPYMANPKFLEWLEAALKKTNASNTNVDVSSLLLDHFEADLLPERYPSLSNLMPPRPPAASCKQLFR